MNHTYSKRVGGKSHCWDVQYLWESSKDLTAVGWEIPPSFNKEWSWGQDHLSEHIARVFSANLSYPIIVHENSVIDGCHRVVKALAFGNKSINAVILEEMPPNYTVEEPRPEESNEGVFWTFGDLVKIVRAVLSSEYEYRHPADGF